MGSAEVWRSVGFGAAKEMGHESFLVLFLLGHVGVGEEMADALIVQNSPIEVFDSETDGEFTAEALVETGHCNCLGEVWFELRRCLHLNSGWNQLIHVWSHYVTPDPIASEIC